MVHFYLTPPELAHYRSLYEGAGHFKIPADLDAKGKRERALVALESVIPREDVRTVADGHDVTVSPGSMANGKLRLRWEKFGEAMAGGV